MNTTKLSTDILIIGGGTSGVCAAIQAGRMGAEVIIVDETEWLGGMLSAAGVSAIDGNHYLPSGLWGEFRRKIHEVYGGPDKVKTGWVSHTLFEPRTANKIFNQMIDGYDNIKVIPGFWPVKADIIGNKVGGAVFENATGDGLDITARISIEATEYGDFLPLAGCAFRTGRESKYETGEDCAPECSDPAVQDITYVAIVKDFGERTAPQAIKPVEYDPEIFRGCCQEWAHPGQTGLSSARRMLEYGRLPNDRYMINWPIRGNDYPGDLLELNREERRIFLDKAKEKTQAFVYFIQNELGYTHLGLDNEQFPSQDHLPLIPYIRESRRVIGKELLTATDLIAPEKSQLYRQNIAVGDYPLDHHHMDARISADENYPSIPAFGVPSGCLIPNETEGLVVAEKSISVTHVVNGCTRLQPVVMQIGQAAGAIAALSIRTKMQPRDLPVTDIQNQLLADGVWLMPVNDLPPDDVAFVAVQKAAVRGLIKGKGHPSEWENKYFIHPDRELTEAQVSDIIGQVTGNRDQLPNKNIPDKICTIGGLIYLIWQVKNNKRISKEEWEQHACRQAMAYITASDRPDDWFSRYRNQRSEPVSRKKGMYLIDRILNIF